MYLIQAISGDESIVDLKAVNECLVDEAEYFFSDGVIAVAAEEMQDYVADGWVDSSTEIIHLYDKIAFDERFYL